MTGEEKKTIIEEAQKYVNYYYETPNDPMYFDTRRKFGLQYEAVAQVYYRLTGALLHFEGDDHIVKEMEV